MRKLFSCLFALLVIVLSGCASQVEPPFDHPTYQPTSWLKRKIHLSNTTSWDIGGSIGIQNRDKAQMGTFTWQQIGPRYAINFYGPLNIGAIGIAGQPGKVTLNKPTGSYSAPTAELLMQQQLGWYLPVSNMYYWIRGLPAPGPVQKQHQDKFGHLVYLQQQGWTIQFATFEPHLNADLPRKIWLENQQLHVKLVIKEWKIN